MSDRRYYYCKLVIVKRSLLFLQLYLLYTEHLIQFHCFHKIPPFLSIIPLHPYFFFFMEIPPNLIMTLHCLPFLHEIQTYFIMTLCCLRILQEIPPILIMTLNCLPFLQEIPAILVMTLHCSPRLLPLNLFWM